MNQENIDLFLADGDRPCQLHIEGQAISYRSFRQVAQQ